MWLFFTACFLLYLLYIIAVKRLKYWESREIPGPKPLPFIGNVGVSLIGMKNVSEVYADIYRKYEDCPFVGVYRMEEPFLMIRDPEIIKCVLIKDFNHFMDNDIFADKNTDPLISRNPFSLKGEEWKKARQYMTPHFATGKIKAVFPLAETVSKNLVAFLEKQEGLVLNAKELFTKFNCDLIALCAFGIEGNSFEKSDAEFVNLAKKFVTPGSFQALKLALSFILPKLITIKFVPKSFDDGVISLTKETIQHRKENNIVRNDFFDAVSNNPSFSVMDVAAHVANLMIDGFESSSTVTTFALYELGANLECQNKLRNEIYSVLEKYDGKLTYEAMQEMTYLDACVNETLRLHPILAQLSKTCTERYTMTSSNTEFRNLSVTLEKGTSVMISLLGLQRDPKYFVSPNEFIPERFLEKSENIKYVFMPFGNGPRMCLGNRFGIMQVKLGILQVIKNFEIILDERTLQPLQYDPLYFSLYPKGEVWFTCKKMLS